MPADMLVYQVSQSWAETGHLLTRLLQQGASLGNRERRTVRESAAFCEKLVRILTGPSEDLPMVEVAAALLEVVQPMYSRPLLVEHLAQAQDALARLQAVEPGLETTVLAPEQLAWLQEFLSECCLLLLRDLATRQLRHHAIAVGS